MQFGNMLQEFFNYIYRGSKSLPTRIIESFIPRELTFSKSTIETLEHAMKYVQS